MARPGNPFGENRRLLILKLFDCAESTLSVIQRWMWYAHDHKIWGGGGNSPKFMWRCEEFLWGTHNSGNMSTIGISMFNISLLFHSVQISSVPKPASYAWVMGVFCPGRDSGHLSPFSIFIVSVATGSNLRASIFLFYCDTLLVLLHMWRSPHSDSLIIIFINCNWFVTRWQWLFYM